MKTRLLLLSGIAILALAAPATAQLLGAKEGPVAMGHHHINASDMDAHKRFWGELLGGKPITLGNIQGFNFPNVLIFLREHEPSRGSIGTSVNHIGFAVKDIRQKVSKLKEAGIPIVTSQQVTGGRAQSDIFYSESQGKHLAFVMAPDNLKVELMEDVSLSVSIANHHIHYATTDVAGLKAWYAKVFGANPGMRGQFEAADLPGVNLTFSPSETAVQPIQGGVLDHTGFEIENLKEFCAKLEKMGIKFDRPYQEVPALNLKLAFLTDPAGVYIELTEGLDRL